MHRPGSYMQSLCLARPLYISLLHDEQCGSKHESCSRPQPALLMSGMTADSHQDSTRQACVRTQITSNDMQMHTLRQHGFMKQRSGKEGQQERQSYRCV